MDLTGGDGFRYPEAVLRGGDSSFGVAEAEATAEHRPDGAATKASSSISFPLIVSPLLCRPPLSLLVAALKAGAGCVEQRVACIAKWHTLSSNPAVQISSGQPAVMPRIFASLTKQHFLPSSGLPGLLPPYWMALSALELGFLQPGV